MGRDRMKTDNRPQVLVEKKKKSNLFANRLATILLVQSKLLPTSALGIKDLKDKI